MSKLYAQLRRRNVIRVGAAYLVVAWLAIQVIDVISPILVLPDSLPRLVLIVLAIGFPIALLLAWIFEITPEGVQLEDDDDSGGSQKSTRKFDFAIIGVLMVAIGFLLVDKFFLDESDALTSIAVMPFKDMSAEGNQAYFGDGIAEELLNALVAIDGLKVASRTSAFSLRNANLDLPTIASVLGVKHILEGSIRTSGNQVRVTAKLVDAENDKQLWSSVYKGNLSDIFDIQDEIASRIAGRVGEITLPRAIDTLTDNPEAFRLYLEGRHLWRQRNPAALRNAEKLLEEALELDPQFHQAWSNLGLVRFLLPDYDASFDFSTTHAKATAAADRAIELAPESSEGPSVKAAILQMQCDYVASARLFEKALQNQPNDPTARQWYSIVLVSLGQLDKARSHIQRAQEIDSLIAAPHYVRGSIELAAGNLREARQHFKKASDLGMGPLTGHSMSIALAFDDDFAGARKSIDNLFPGELATGKERRQLFLDALEDPAGIGPFVAYVTNLISDDSLHYRNRQLIIEELTALNSTFAFDVPLADANRCNGITSLNWAEQTRELRGTPEFFHWMEDRGAVEYWQTLGWPDNCKELDSSLASCPAR